jgi:hypothetical protein
MEKENSVTVGSEADEKNGEHESSTPASAGARNLAAYRATEEHHPALKHGIHEVIASGGESIPNVPGAAEVARDVDALISQSITDMGYANQAELPAMRRSVLASQRLALLVLGLASEYILREGIVNAKGKPHPLLSILGTFGNSVRLNAVALGLERRAKDVHTLDSVMREYKDKAENTAKEPPTDA